MPKETLLVRLRPHNPRRGFVLRKFTYQSVIYNVEQGWYEVPLDTANYLRNVKSSETDPNSPFAFDVCTVSEAKDIVLREENAKRSTPENAMRIHKPTVGDARIAAQHVGALTTHDLPTNAKELPGSEADLDSEDLASDVTDDVAAAVLPKAVPVHIPGAPLRRKAPTAQGVAGSKTPG